jgi:hypothetical protein
VIGYSVLFGREVLPIGRRPACCVIPSTDSATSNYLLNSASSSRALRWLFSRPHWYLVALPARFRMSVNLRRYNQPQVLLTNKLQRPRFLAFPTATVSAGRATSSQHALPPFNLRKHRHANVRAAYNASFISFAAKGQSLCPLFTMPLSRVQERCAGKAYPPLIHAVKRRTVNDYYVTPNLVTAPPHLAAASVAVLATALHADPLVGCTNQRITDRNIAARRMSPLSAATEIF